MFRRFPPRMTLHASSPSKRPRISQTASPQQIAVEALAAEEELARQRFLSQSKLKSNWERIFAKYSQDFEGIADEIDQATGNIVVDNGHVRSMEDSLAIVEDEEKWDWEEIVEEEVSGKGATKGRVKGKGKGKKPRLGNGKLLGVKASTEEDDEWEDTPAAEDCKVCKYRDELDDSVCQGCSLKPSTPPTPLATATTTAPKTYLTLDSAPIGSTDSAMLTSTITGSSPRRSPRNLPNGGDVSMGGMMDGMMDGASDPVPSDAFTIEKLGPHGAAVVGLLAEARAQDATTSPVPIFTRGGDTPRKSKTSYIRGERIEIDTSPRQLRSQQNSSTAPPPAKTPASPKSYQDQTDIRTWSPIKVTTWLLTHGVLSDEEDTDIVYALKVHDVSGAVIASGLTLDDLKDKLKIESFSRRMQLWSGILKLKASVPHSSTAKPPSPRLEKGTTALGEDIWAPPPQEQDPFYSHIWRDEHPDGTPARFPPRIMDPVFSTPGPAATSGSGEATPEGSSAKGKKRKRNSSADSGPEGLNTMESVTIPAASGGVKTPAKKAKVVKGVRAKIPAVRTPAMKTYTAKKGSAKSTPVKTPARRTLAAKTPATKTPAKLKTPVAKAVPKTMVPGWTTGSIGRTKKRAVGKSFLGLGDAEGKDDELSVDHVKSSPVPVQIAKEETPVEAIVQVEGNGDEVGGSVEEDKMEGIEGMGEKGGEGGQRKEHKCSRGFCFVCLNLDGEEDDLI